MYYGYNRQGGGNPQVKAVGSKSMRYTQKDIRQKLGITRDALRLYEKRGIIQPEIDLQNGYRYYDDWQMNLLWDCRYYQGMGFSLAEVQEILSTDSLGRIEARLEHRETEMRHELLRHELALHEHSRFLEELRLVKSDLGVVTERDFAGCICVVEREQHTIAQETCAQAIAFANRNVSLMKPYFWFPEAGGRRYYWGSAMRLEVYRKLEEEPGNEGVLELPPCRALSTVLDAGERGGFGAELFLGLLDAVAASGHEITGPLHGELLARTHDTAGFHRYVRAYVPVG